MENIISRKGFSSRLDETIVPYTVRHLSRVVDKSKEKRRNDRLTWEEFQKMLNFFNSDKRVQAYLMLALEPRNTTGSTLYKDKRL